MHVIGGALLAAELDAERAIREGRDAGGAVMSGTAQTGTANEKGTVPNSRWIFSRPMATVNGSADSPRIRVSARARRLSIRVYPDARVEVVVPPRARPREVEQFIAAHRRVDRQQARSGVAQPAGAQAFPPAAIELRVDRRGAGGCIIAGGSGPARVA